ncbi:hypothetical protein EIO_0992 [Ketogulonicigenium vulgare Y25]|uniref:Uncharacterized protein n=1 Tax=Ketogulonicigenium vulgare (strain WSH-001) TaxID=759362 RepID=F9Y3A2_KETVW|nr:hypothetical protein EIO_0992 [Ketogulonicigenium vulgare Y25]AEM40343.1 hypothetical protein KVU_0504 [Ketogulonicigenium vulgare WSH-001]ALJ80538.1 hypothetical protein KVH_04705 [Ketogulonicigenium vulgare]ANW34939.1 hypothetical protein KvSKV_04675 [Ketogulonicigenium vulgare]AOZ54056.1 hypothetical protein KVC_1039 [Ketogulonicigenium vulgare]
MRCIRHRGPPSFAPILTRHAPWFKALIRPPLRCWNPLSGWDNSRKIQ